MGTDQEGRNDRPTNSLEIVRQGFGEVDVKDVQWLVDAANTLDVQPPKLGIVIKNRTLAKKAVRECKRCVLRREDETPVPISGPHLPSFVVVGEAPERTEIEEGEPFVGKSGVLLKALMAGAGIEYEDVAFMNTVGCWPRDERNGRTVAPDFKSQLACRDHFRRQLTSCYTKYILLVGATALHAFRDDLTLSRTQGKVLIGQDGLVLMCIPHPIGMLKNPDKEHSKKAVIGDLQKWKWVVDGGDVGELIMGLCAECGAAADEWDEDAVGYCAGCWEKGKEKRNKARVKWRGGGGYGQEVLFDGT